MSLMTSVPWKLLFPAFVKRKGLGQRLNGHAGAEPSRVFEFAHDVAVTAEQLSASTLLSSRKAGSRVQCAQALSPAVQPRALWVVAHHLEVAASMDTACMNLLRALAEALSANEDLVNSRRHNPSPAPCSVGTVKIGGKCPYLGSEIKPLTYGDKRRIHLEWDQG